MSENGERGGIEPLTAELRREAGDDLFNKLGELAERWNNRLRFERLSLVEDYRRGRLKILIDFEIANADVCGHWDSDRNDIALRAYFEVRQGNVGFPISGTKTLNRMDAGERDDGGMLVDDVQVVQSPDGPIPSRVRFQPLDGGNSLWAGSGVLYFVFGRGFETRHIFSGRKVSAFDVAATYGDKIRCEMVKGASKIMDDIADDAAKARCGRVDHTHNANLVCPLVFADQKMIRVTFPESGKLSFNLCEVAIGPFDL